MRGGSPSACAAEEPHRRRWRALAGRVAHRSKARHPGISDWLDTQAYRKRRGVVVPDGLLRMVQEMDAARIRDEEQDAEFLELLRGLRRDIRRSALPPFA